MEDKRTIWLYVDGCCEFAGAEPGRLWIGGLAIAGYPDGELLWEFYQRVPDALGTAITAELYAVLTGVIEMMKRAQPGEHYEIRSDNEWVVNFLRKQFDSKVPEYMQMRGIVIRAAKNAQKKGATMKLAHVPGKDNDLADWLSRHAKAQDLPERGLKKFRRKF